MKFSFIVYHTLWELIDWVYPPTCSGCGSPGSRWCDVCDKELIHLSDSVCETCGYPIDRENLCSKCFEVKPNFNETRSLYQYQSNIRNALHHLKYDNDLGVGEILGKKCAEYLTGLQWEIDYIVPVPLGKKRQKERGYNQAALIAYPASLVSGIPYSSKCLIRSKETVTQVDFTSEQRKQNVREAFRADERFISGKNILVVDDIITTGSTIDACAIALRNVGANSVYGLSVARTMLETKLT